MVITGASISNTVQKVTPYYGMYKHPKKIGPETTYFISPKCSISAAAGEYGCALGPLAKPLFIVPGSKVIFYPGGGAVGTDRWYFRYFLIPLPGGIVR